MVVFLLFFLFGSFIDLLCYSLLFYEDDNISKLGFYCVVFFVRPPVKQSPQNDGGFRGMIDNEMKMKLSQVSQTKRGAFNKPYLGKRQFKMNVLKLHFAGE